MMTLRLRRYLDDMHLPTPVLVVDLDCIEQKYRAMSTAMPGAIIYYAVKANPTPEVIARLASLGCHFDVASGAEIMKTTVEMIVRLCGMSSAGHMNRAFIRPAANHTAIPALIAVPGPAPNRGRIAA